MDSSPSNKHQHTLSEPMSDHIELTGPVNTVASHTPIMNPSDPYESGEPLTLSKAVRRYPKVVGYCLGLSVAIIGWGYGLVVVGSVTAVDTFREDFGSVYEGQLIIPSFWLSLWLALPPAAAAVGAIAGGWLGDKIGRKFSLMTGSLFSCAAVAIVFFSRMTSTQDGRRTALTAGLTVQGFSVGLIKVISVTYVSEITPTSLRGPAMGLFPTFTLFGQLLGVIIVFVVNGSKHERGYMTAFGSIWVLTAALFILTCFMPDSPARLLRSNQEANALRAATKLYAPKIDPKVALERTRHAILEEEALAEKATYIYCFRGTNLRRTLLVILANVMPALFGLDFLSNGSYFVTLAGLESSKALLITMGGVIAGVLANLVGIWVLSRVGRRKATMVSLACAGILWGAAGATGFWYGATPAMIAGILLVFITITCGMGCWAASYAIMGETSTLRLRSLTQGVGGVATQAGSTLMAVILPYIYNPDAAALGMKTAFIFLALCFITIAIIWQFLPEMKDRSIEDIDHMFELKLPARQFKKWKRAPGSSGSQQS